MRDFLRFFNLIHVFLKARLDILLIEKFKSRWISILFAVSPWQIYSSNKALGERIRLALEEAGPIFIKFGQLLSTRPDIIPTDITKSLQKLRDDLPPFPTDLAKEIIEKELGSPLENVFSEFESTPIAAASIAQVYSAKLRRGGSEVAIKVVRPGLQKKIKRDISLMKRLAKRIEKHFLDAKRLKLFELVEEYEAVINTELDMRVEASNMRQTRRNFKENNLLYVPEVFLELSTRKVLIMEKINGIPVDNLDLLKEKRVNLRLLSERGVEIFLKQVFIDNFFHADMHPGNIFINSEDPLNPSYLAVDYAIVGSLTEEEQFQIGKMLLSVISRDFLEVANILITSGWVDPKTRPNDLERTIRSACEPMFEQPLENIRFGELLLYIFDAARRFDLKMQPSLMLLQKTLINIEGLGKQLYPQLDFWSIAKPFLQNWISERYNPKKLEEWAKKNAGQWIERARKLPEVAENVLNQINKLDDLHKSSKERHEELINTIKKERKSTRLLVVLFLVLIFSLFLSKTIN